MLYSENIETWCKYMQYHIFKDLFLFIYKQLQTELLSTNTKMPIKTYSC